MARRGDYFELVADVARREMEWVGVTPWEDMPTTALHIEAVRRVQVWTLEWLAKSLKPGNAMVEMFEQLAHGVERVPEVDLWMGEQGATGGCSS